MKNYKYIVRKCDEFVKKKERLYVECYKKVYNCIMYIYK